MFGVNRRGSNADQRKPMTRSMAKVNVSFGFTCVLLLEKRALNVIFARKKLSADGAKPNVILQHLESSHADVNNLSRDFYLRRRERVKREEECI